ncbi:MAG: hypothetical protein DWQ05_10900 [Calditrichaeota bacterium]|nr:MAG: hypothetical protein DWQ05_10900 [Calditrichota bacterium]
MLKKLFVSMIVLFFSPCLLFAQVQEKLHLATGSTGGLYFELGWDLKNAIAAKYMNSLSIIVDSTRGSMDNTLLLGNNEVQLALIQEDIASSFKKGTRNFQRTPYENLTVIAALKSSELIYIFLPKGSTVKSVFELTGKRIATGERKSGTAFNAAAILDAYGLDSTHYQQVFLPLNSAIDSLQSQRIDAMFFTANPDAPFLQKIMTRGFPLLPIEAKMAEQLTDNYPFFSTDTIFAENQNLFIPTLSVQTLFVARKDVPNHIIYKIANTIFSVPRGHRLFGKFQYYSGNEPLHTGAKNYYKIDGHHQWELYDWLSFLVILGFPAGVLILIVFYQRNIRRLFRHNIYFRLTVILLSLFIIGTLGTYYFEKDVNENFDDFLGSFWITMIYLLIGFEGSNPITLGGKISSILILIGSVGVLGSVAGNFAAMFLREKGDKIPMDIKDHIVICYWNNRGDDIVRELRQSEHGKNAHIIIMFEEGVDEAALRKKSYYRDVLFVKDNPTNSTALECVNVTKAKSVIILSDQNNDKPDPQTIICCLAIDKLAKKTKPYIIAELMDRSNKELTEGAGANEVVSAGFYRTGIMLQSALYHGMSHIFHELLQYEQNKTSVFIVTEKNIPQEFYDEKLTFQDAARKINEKRKAPNPVILIGVKRGDQIILNPHSGKKRSSKDVIFDHIKKGDALVVLAEKFPKL